MIINTVMDTTLPPDIMSTHVQGMQEEELPGFYNSTCGPFAITTCFSQFYLQCVDGRCVCFDNYEPNGSGGCKEDVVTLMVTWIIRLFVSASIFLICLTIFHLLVSSRCCQRARSEREEEDVEESRSITRLYDEPPPYLEAVEEDAPPTYQEAVAKESECDIEAPTTTTERDTPREPPTTTTIAERGVEIVNVNALLPPFPVPTDIYTHQTLHI